jgi:hypothetical protein
MTRKQKCQNRSKEDKHRIKVNLFQKKLDARSQSQSRRMAIKIHQNKEKSNQKLLNYGRQQEDLQAESNLSTI